MEANSYDRERARRENAVNHALRWNQIDRTTSLATHIAERLD